uniref:PIN domain-containing protein n=1 Tax=Plectus sambesii TaxID=2011161 RepID=A0A914WG96_9BILA
MAEVSGETNQTRKRPEQQIYRPGAFRGGRSNDGRDEPVAESPVAENAESWRGGGKQRGNNRQRSRNSTNGGAEWTTKPPPVSYSDRSSAVSTAFNQRPPKQNFDPEKRDYGQAYQATSSRPKGSQIDAMDTGGGGGYHRGGGSFRGDGGFRGGGGGGFRGDGRKNSYNAPPPPVQRSYSRRQSEDRQSLYDGDDQSRCGTPDTIAGDRPNRPGGRRMGSKRNSVNDINFSPKRGGRRRRSDDYQPQPFQADFAGNWQNRSNRGNSWTAAPRQTPSGRFNQEPSINRTNNFSPNDLPPHQQNQDSRRGGRDFNRPARGQSNDVRSQGVYVRQKSGESATGVSNKNEDWRQYVNRNETKRTEQREPVEDQLPAATNQLERIKLNDIGSSFESLLKEPVGHLDWSSEVEHELERRAEEEKRQREQQSSNSQRGGLLVVSHDALNPLNPRPSRGFGGPRPANQLPRGGGRGSRIEHGGFEPSSSTGPVQSTTNSSRGFMGSSPRSNGSGRGERGRRGFSTSTSKPSNTLPPRFQRLQDAQRAEQQPYRRQQSPQRQREEQPIIEQPQQQQQQKQKQQQRAGDGASTVSGVQYEISMKGPQIEMLNERMTQLIQSMHHGADVLNDIIDVSAQTAELYRQIIPLDIDYSFQTNLEQHLWKQSFYKPIEELRHFLRPDSTNDAVANALLTLIQNARTFYEALIAEYESEWQFKLGDFVYWSAGLPTDDFEAALMCSTKEPTDRKMKVALLSAQRLTVSLGDLLRYETQIRKKRDFSEARSYYLKAVQLSPTNGRSHNQLGLLAVYAQKKLDMMYHYVRAIAARHAFDTARQSLMSGFDEMRKRVDVYEKELREQLGQLRSSESKTAESSSERPREVWIGLDGKESKGEAEELSAKMGDLEMRMLCNETAATLYKRTIYYLLHVAGMLVSKIGMEQYDQLAEKAVLQLRALLDKEDSPLTAQQLLQLTTICLYCVHNAAIKEIEPGTCPLQQQQAVQLVLSIWGVLLEQMNAQLASFASYLRGQIQPPAQMRRVLPAVQLMCEWASMPLVNEIYRAMPSLDGIDSERMRVDTWAQLAALCNQLVAFDEDGLICKPRSSANTEGAVQLVLPESVYSTSFCNVFSGQPKTLSLAQLSGECGAVGLPSVYALHARLRSVLSAAEYLDGSELRCFQTENGRFVSTETGSSSSPPPPVARRAHASDDEDETAEQLSSGDEADASDEQRKLRLQRKHERVKETMRNREADLRGLVIEVRPSYLIPDTNTFIDHMTTMETIIEAKKWTILLPTVVLSELRGLSAAADDEWVRERAKTAVDFLNKAEERKLSLQAITSVGNRINSLKFAHEDCGTTVKPINFSSCPLLNQ